MYTEEEIRKAGELGEICSIDVEHLITTLKESFVSDRYLMNRLANSHNRFQGKNKKVLCVCSAGLLRSPTVAFVLSQEPYNYNTRCAGISPQFALIPVDRVLLEWADEIVCMDAEQEQELGLMVADKPIINLNISDNFEYRNPILIDLIKQQYAKHV